MEVILHVASPTSLCKAPAIVSPSSNTTPSNLKFPPLGPLAQIVLVFVYLNEIFYCPVWVAQLAELATVVAVGTRLKSSSAPIVSAILAAFKVSLPICSFMPKSSGPAKMLKV